MDYQSITPTEFLIIDQIYTIHYFEYMSDFTFPGESHDFWELLYVDKGKVIVQSEMHEYTLDEGHIIFHKPNEFHNIKANGEIAPNLVVISFTSPSPPIEFFKEKIFTLKPMEKNLLANIITEARKSYSTPLGDPYYTKLTTSSNIHPYSEHLIKLYLELFLIYLYRRYNYATCDPILDFTSNNDHSVYTHIHNYLIQNLQKQLSLTLISNDLLISPPKLQKIIKHYHHCSVMEYFSLLKIDFSKQLIRTNTFNLSQIADYLGYSSIHYFSRQFKKLTGMTPTQYSVSIKALSEYPSDLTYQVPVYENKP